MNTTLPDSLFNRDSTPSPLHERYTTLKQEASLYRREIAEKLDVSEAELIDAQCDVQSIRLNNREFGELIKQLPALGYIKTLTRNDYAVHERKGVYGNITINGPMGLVISDDRKVDLRIILPRWQHGFAVREPMDKGPRYSLQFFGQSGTAIQKIILQPKSDTAAYAELVQKFRAQDQHSPLTFSPIADTPLYADDQSVDVARLTEEWLGMTDVHQFFGILKNHNVSREQAFRLVSDDYAQPIEPSCVEPLLTRAAEKAIPIMCFVGNHGNIQIHSGMVKNIQRMGPWLNVLDPEFNLHLLEEGVASAWLVRKPCDTGWVTSVELYDAQGRVIAQFFGVRKEGEEEIPAWRQLAYSLLSKERRVA